MIDEVILEDGSVLGAHNPAEGDSYGIQQPVKPSDDEGTSLQVLADAIQGSIE